MNNNPVPAAGKANMVIKEKSTPWLIWLLPIIALCIGGWLIYKSYRDAGVEVVFLLPLGSDIKPNETEIKYEGVHLGVVKATMLSQDLKQVRAVAEIDKRGRSILQEDTVFWLVKPKITISQVSGLDTLVSGKYITFQLGEKTAKLPLEALRELEPAKFEYDVLAEAPPRPPYLGGIQLEIVSDKPVSISEGAPVTFQKFTVGEVDKVSLSADGKTVRYRVFIEEPYKDLINSKTRFWNASGISLKGSLSNVEVKMDSLTSVLVGGISFTNDPDASDAQPVGNFHEFVLLDDYADADIQQVAFLLPLGSAITPGDTAIKYEGVTVGVVKRTELTSDLKKIRAVAEMDRRGAMVLQEDTVFWLVKPRITISQISGLDTLVSGKYITFQLGEKTSQLSLEELRKLKPAKFEYEVLSHAPPRPQYVGGLQLEIVSPEPVAISEGAPVTFQKFTVGEVDKVALDADGKTVRYQVFIEEQYKHLINSKTRFWDASGISLKGSLSNVEVKMDSLASVLVGGISFGNAPDAGPAKPVGNFHEFRLHASSEAAFSKKTLVRIRFASGDGLVEGMPVKYNGLQVGEVESIELQGDLKAVTVVANLHENATNLARVDSKFWVVKPELGLAATRNLETLVTGKYITVEPGTGEPGYQFAGLDAPPQVQSAVGDDGLKIVLLANNLGSVTQGTKVYYRKVVVGTVDGSGLAGNAKKVQIHVTIDRKFAPLIRQNTRFWNASGIDVGFKLFGGLKVSTESVESLLEGGIALATPDNDKMGDAVSDGAVFKLYDDADDDWEAWSPDIPLGE